MKTSRCFILAMTFIFMLAWPGSIFAQTADPPSGTGTSEDPYLIATLNNLYWVTQNSGSWDKYFKQTADIDATTTSGWHSGAGFLPVGNPTTPFTGSYNGQGGFITTLTINRPSTYYTGMFGLVEGGEIENLGISAVITGSWYAGAIAGYVYSSSTISNCLTSGTVAGDYFIGGMIGSLEDGSTLDNCGSLAAVSGDRYVGGLVGRNLAIITDSYASGSVNGTVSDEGGLVGGTANPTVSNSFWDTQTSTQAVSAGGTGKTTVEMKTLATFTSAATSGLTTPWDFIGTPNDDAGIEDWWNIDNTGTINSGYPVPSWNDFPITATGSGSEADPYQITTLNNLYWLTSTPAAWAAGVYIEQTADIYAYSTAYINFSTGWDDIGDGYNTQFYGTYDGKGHEIKGLTINGPSNGFIDYMNAPGSITDLHLTDLDYTLTQDLSGGLVGYFGYNNDGLTISKCSVSGSMSSQGNNYYLGLLVGAMRAGTIEQCWTSGTVSGRSGVGGLIGRKAYYNSIIHGIINDCYSTANVSCTVSKAGGLIGNIGGYGSNPLTINNCYSTGLVTGPTDIGGFIGNIDPTAPNTTITDCFWDTQTSGTSDGVGNMDPDPAGITGKTTTEMKTQSTFTDAGWDFVGETTNGTEDIWDIDPTQTINTGYPFFSWQDTYAVWNGSQNNEWNNPANWSGGPGVPTSVKNVIIPDVANDPVISTAAEVANLIIQSGATLTIDTDGSLTVNGAPITDAGGNGSLIMLTK